MPDLEWFHEAIRLIADLEHGVVPFDETIYRPQIEQLITELMDKTFLSTNQQEKTKLAVLELRARGLRERWLMDKTKQN